MDAAGIQARFVQGRRYTDSRTLEIVEQVLAQEDYAQQAEESTTDDWVDVGEAPRGPRQRPLNKIIGSINPNTHFISLQVFILGACPIDLQALMLGFHVPSEVPATRRCEVTPIDRALEWALSCVFATMGSQVAPLRSCVIAARPITYIWLLACMHTHVPCKMAAARRAV